jgi:hypothetical protein
VGQRARIEIQPFPKYQSGPRRLWAEARRIRFYVAGAFIVARLKNEFTVAYRELQHVQVASCKYFSKRKNRKRASLAGAIPRPGLHKDAPLFKR